MSLDYLHLSFEPIANPVASARVRFTVLNSRLLQPEYGLTGIFKNRPGQTSTSSTQGTPA